MTILGMAVTVTADNAEEEMSPEELADTKEILWLTCVFMRWFVNDNEDNQQAAFEELEFFVDFIDSGIGVHLIVQETFRNNEKLCKMVPSALINQFCESIVTEGRHPLYMDILK